MKKILYTAVAMTCLGDICAVEISKIEPCRSTKLDNVNPHTVPIGAEYDKGAEGQSKVKNTSQVEKHYQEHEDSKLEMEVLEEQHKIIASRLAEIEKRRED